jgi:hypothetical protein
MAVPCRQCGTLVDESAPVCPHCGMSNPAGRPSGTTFAVAGPSPIVIRGVDIPFGDLVVLIIKMALAAIPAYIVLFIIFSIIFAILASIFGGLSAGVLGLLF